MLRLGFPSAPASFRSAWPSASLMLRAVLIGTLESSPVSVEGPLFDISDTFRVSLRFSNSSIAFFNATNRDLTLHLRDPKREPRRLVLQDGPPCSPILPRGLEARTDWALVRFLAPSATRRSESGFAQVCLTWHLPPSRFDLLGGFLLQTPSTCVDRRSWGSKLTVSNWRPCSARVSVALEPQTTGVGGSICKQTEDALPWVTRAAIHPSGDQSLDAPS